MSEIEISLGDVTDMEARVYARFSGRDDLELRGVVRGPHCDNARTLPAEFPFRKVVGGNTPIAEAIITDPCVWTAELPHVYEVEVKAMRNGNVVAEHRETMGLRRVAPRRPVDFAPGTG